MANVLSIDKQAAIIGSVCEDSSIRSIERVTGVHRDTIMRLGVRICRSRKDTLRYFMFLPQPLRKPQAE